MIDANGSGDYQTVADVRPVVLVRYRPGVTGEAIRAVHVVPLPLDGQQGAATALCEMWLHLSEIEIVVPGHGMPCDLCLTSLIAASPAPPTPGPSSHAAHPDTGHQDTAADYHRWGWPVTVRRDQVRLCLAPTTVALIIPTLLAAEVTEVLTARHCQPAVLTHPHAPEHRVLLAGEPYPVVLPWPPRVGRVTTHLQLPLTLTPRGPLRWVQPPHENSLRLCREIDVLAAVRTTLQQSPRGDHMSRHEPPKPQPDPSDDGHKPGQTPPPREPGKHEKTDDPPPPGDPRDPR
ncbi:MAG TPA: hypothetical protein VFN75_09570 [Pseudonocardiaceae bacterium]|nr:hypothetical protein [Pseudonocardiaceae bacterium]